MKNLTEMTQAEVAAFVESHLRRKGIDVVLSGGAAVAIYSANLYVSRDIDLVNVNLVDRKRIKAAMEEIGFREVARYFHHPRSRHIVEFPVGPLAIDDLPVQNIASIRLSTGTLRIISAADCVKDRLAAYYYWGDQASLQQAVLVAQKKRVRLAEIRRWSARIDKMPAFEIFRRKAAARRKRSGTR